ncbi:MAG TPA: hypothetical protein VHV51_07470 [Polyangiaceae bacterium]|nr:hypothetical protein [Polyangiaceae bacterium]
MLSATQRAFAYRPFDGTDAAVAELGHFELELGPAHYYRLGSHDYLIAPATVLNLGFAREFELVSDFSQYVGLERVPGESQVRLANTDILVKWVFRRGKLQDASGLSMAIEAGPLLPEINGDEGFGLQADVIESYRWPFGALHLNEQVARSRLDHLALFGSAILEGPGELTVRPVAELLLTRELELGSVYSALGGVIWSAADELDIDGGLRVAREGGLDALEVRFGLTWSPRLWTPSTPE